LLGIQQTFSDQYAIPIENGRNKDATESDFLTAGQVNKELQTLLEPHLLQRLKEVEIKQSLPRKKDLVVWTHLSASQRKLYEKFNREDYSTLQAISWLRSLCSHPCLVGKKLPKSCKNKVQFLIKHSAKLKVLLDLVEHLYKNGHRFLIFSQSVKMLDIIQNIVPFSLARIDGETENRQCIVDSFNRPDSSFAGMVLSTKAGGVGLTLTGADSAIIYDPSWNPSEDLQAADRIYRIGQKKDVTIYRFIAAGTVEGEFRRR
jgi:SNF2 family DNA or RNA helicase